MADNEITKLQKLLAEKEEKIIYYKNLYEESQIFLHNCESKASRLYDKFRALPHEIIRDIKTLGTTSTKFNKKTWHFETKLTISHEYLEDILKAYDTAPYEE